MRSCSINTTEPNEVCAAIHDRMPVIVPPEDYRRWLGEVDPDPVRLLMLLKPYPAERMEAYKVGPRVRNVKNDDAALIERQAEPST